MIAIQQKKLQAEIMKPFPNELTSAAFGIFTGLDIEVFDCDLIDKIHKSGFYGLNPKPRQMVAFNMQTENNLSNTNSLVLFPEEAFFLHQYFNLQVQDLQCQLMSSERLWSSLCDLKETFVECYIAYLYLKSKNWVIKPGIKFGSDYCELKR